MRIAIVNKFWYARGGDCVVAMNTASLLRRMGHEVHVFSMHYPENVPCDDSDRFVSQVHFDGNLSQKLKAFRRSMGDMEVREKFTSFINDFRPHVVHLHNIHSYISPIVAQIAHNAGCRVVWTMHDYKLLCPAYSCLRNGEACMSCIEHPLDVVSNKCIKNSLPASIAGLLEISKWNVNVLNQCVDTFICPSLFMAQHMQHADFPAEKLAVIHNFLPDDKRETAPIVTGRAPYYCYAGRLSHEKGVEVLLEAAATLPMKLKVAGDGPLLNELKLKYDRYSNIEFTGKLTSGELMAMMRLARFSVMPSICLENNPMSVIESLCVGTPVVGADTGGIPELINPQENGLLMRPGDVTDIARALQQAWNKSWDYSYIARTATAQFDSTTHYRQLMNVYKQELTS